MSNTNFFFIKLSCPKDVTDLNFYSLLKKLSEEVLQEHKFNNIPNNLHLANKGDIIIFHIGGDSSNKNKYFKHNKLPEFENYENGIHAIGILQKSIIDKKEVIAKVIGIKSPVTKSDLYYFPQFIDNLGGSTKGTPNQAGLYELDPSIGLSLIDFLNLNKLLPSTIEEFTKLNSENQLYTNAYKSFQSDFANKESTNNLITNLIKNPSKTPHKKDSIHIRSKFIKWINHENNYKKSYDGLVTDLVLDFWNKAYFNNQLFFLDFENLDDSINKIENLILSTNKEEWLKYSQATSKGAPMAILGKNNYLKFLNELKIEIDSNKEIARKQLQPQIFNFKNFVENCRISGLIYHNIIICRFIASLLTKPFLILTGLSGSGKTKLAQAFVQWICQDESQYRIIPVGADWTNREPMLGYPNALDPTDYVKPDNGVIDLLLDAQKNKNLPYFLVLDEMNLSHVERYFADFLSVMESDEDIPLHDGKEAKNGVPPKLKLPSNLFIIGTVNIDETTNMFSPKVLDRANTIEFRINDIEMEKFLGSMQELNMDALLYKGVNMAENFIHLSNNKSFETNDVDKIYKTLLQFFGELKKTGAEFGYRTASEIMRLIHQISVLDPDLKMDDKIDVAIIQKLLPKLHGSRRKLSPILETLGGFCVENEENIIKNIFENDDYDFNNKDVVKYPLSLEKISRMYNGAIDNGFTSFAEA